MREVGTAKALDGTSDGTLSVTGLERPSSSYLTLSRGTSVVDRFGQPVGSVVRVLLHKGGGFDGVIVSSTCGRRFVDAPEVRRVLDDRLVLGVSVDDVHEPHPQVPKVAGVAHATYGRVDATEADRDAAIAALKTAFVADRLSEHHLADRVEVVHESQTLAELDSALADLLD